MAELLGLSPNSRDAAIFRNASLRTNSASTAGTPPPLSDIHKGSYGNMLRPVLVADLIAVLLVMIPIGS